MEAALRTAANILDGTNEKIDFMDVRGTQGIKEATYRIAGAKSTSVSPAAWAMPARSSR